MKLITVRRRGGLSHTRASRPSGVQSRLYDTLSKRVPVTIWLPSKIQYNSVEMIRTRRGIILLLLLAILVRVFIVSYAIQFRENTDILRYKDWGRIALSQGVAATYKPDYLTFGTYPNNQPPGSLVIISSAYWVWLQIGKALALFGIPPGSNEWVNGPLLTILLRVPSLLADLGIGWMLYSWAGLLAAALFLFNPAVLYNSSFWGQMDAINNFFFLLAIGLLWKRKIAASALSLAASLLMKFSLVFVLPLYALFTWMRGKRRAVATAFLSALIVGGIPLFWYLRHVGMSPTGEMQNVTAFAWNFWWVVFKPLITFGPGPDLFSLSDIRLHNSPVVSVVWPVLLWAVAQLPIYRKVKNTQTSWFSAVAALAIISYLFLPQMHDRYLYPAFAPLALLVGLGIPVLYELILLSLFNFINLLVVWHPMLLPFHWYPVLRSEDFQWGMALATVVLGVWTAWKISKLSFEL